MNFEKYPWLSDLTSTQAVAAIKKAREQYRRTGAVTFPSFITDEALSRCIGEARSKEDSAFTTDDTHTAHLLPRDSSLPENSVRNYEMRTQVASIAFDELPLDSELASLYKSATLLELVKAVVKNSDDSLYISGDPLGCCSVNVFRPRYHHSFHFDESEFSTTLMLQEAAVEGTGLFQYTHPLRQKNPNDMALEAVAAALREYDETVQKDSFCEKRIPSPVLHTLKFSPGTLSIFSGSKSLHRVTRVEGDSSRLVAVFTFASTSGFRNTPEVQKLFWGRSL